MQQEPGPLDSALAPLAITTKLERVCESSLQALLANTSMKYRRGQYGFTIGQDIR